MRDDNLLRDEAKISEDYSRVRRKRTRILLSAAGGILLVVALCAALFAFSSSSPADSSRAGTGVSEFRNHYRVDQASIKYSRFDVAFDLLRDETPDYEGDVIKPTNENQELAKLHTTIATESDHRLHVKICDADHARWEVPLPTKDTSSDAQDRQLSRYQRFNITSSGMSFVIPRFALRLADRDGKSTDSPILSTESTYFRFMEKYIVLEIKLDTDRIFGLGERTSNVSLREGNYTLFSRDQGTPVETRTNPGKNLYGVHPFILYQQRSGLFAGFFLKTSNALQVNIKLGQSSIVRFSTIGGVLDFYVFYKGNAQFILRQYHSLVGRPALPPFWALGYHHGRSGFKNLAELQTLIRNFTLSEIPIDALWVDADILDDGKNFMLNDKTFGGLKGFVDSELHSKHIHFVPSIDPGLKADSSYAYYKAAAEANGLAKGEDGKEFVGKTRQGKVAFPNFYQGKMQELWRSGVKAFAQATGFDGLWLTMNEFSQECNGQCPAGSQGPLDTPPFVPGDTPLNTKTLPMSAAYPTGDAALDKFMYEYNVHSFNSFAMANATSQTFKGENKRVFMASRGTYPGIQQFAQAHWLGDTESSWEQLRYSIPGLINFQMLGLPLVGASVCGYANNATEELCARWMQLGLMYPLSVNLNSKTGTRQEPFAFSLRTMELAKHAIWTKYSVLRYIYTSIFEQSLYGGSSIQPLFFEFPQDRMAYRTSDRVFLYGKGLMVTTPLEKDRLTYSVYFPNANWYKLPTGERVVAYAGEKDEGNMLQLDASNEGPKLFVRGGTILPYQNASDLKVRNTEELQDIPMTLVVALDSFDRAEGRMVVDDGASADTIEKKKYRHYSFTFSNKTLKVNMLQGHNYVNSNQIATYPFESFSVLQIWGADNLKKVTSASAISSNMGRRGLKIYYNAERNVLTVFDDSRKKLQWRQIEAIAVFADNDYNYGVGGFVASKIKITDQLRRMTAVLEPGLDMSDRKFRMEAILMNNYVLNLKISPTDRKAWEVPNIVDPKIRNTTTGRMAFAEYLFAISTDPEPFFFAITNPGDPDDTTITTEKMPVILDEHFIEISTKIKATDIYGLGERVTSKFSLPGGTYTLYANSAMSPVDDGLPPGKNMYSSHPFYMFKTPDGAFVGVFLLNSNAMEVSILPFDEGVYRVDHISTGGLIDMFIIQRGPPKLIIEQYHSIIGKPQVLPFWAFGHHQSRYGYRTQEKLKDVVDRYNKAKLPIESLWVDIDYMDSYVPFTIDTKRYPSMKDFVAWLHKQDIKFVPIVEGAIPVSMEQNSYRMGLDMNVFIGRGNADNNFSPYKHTLAVVWPGYSTFVDYLHPNATEYWVKMLDYLNKEIFTFDGIWLDMNEATNFCDGECDLNGANHKETQTGNALFQGMPYIPGHRNLQHRAIALDAQHYSADPGNKANYMEHNLHSMFGHYEIKATNEYFTRNKKRPFIISRSTFPGSGKYGSHWLGDNWSSWPSLRQSIVGIYNFQMFGIPFTGPDVCGFAGNSTIELCQRWYQLAAFYPFCRNHNQVGMVDQEPYVDEALAATAGIALQLRYSLIRYMYTLHMMVSMHGGAYFMPAFYTFPNDNETYKDAERSFMLGPALKVSPVLEQGAKNVTSYFPNANWYDLSTGAKVVEYDAKEKTGKTIELPATLEANNINVHICGGKIIPRQDNVHHLVQNTRDLHDLEMSFVIAPDTQDRAEGFVFYDDDTAVNSLDSGAYLVYNLTYERGKLNFVSSASTSAAPYQPTSDNKDETLGRVDIFNAKSYQSTKYACANLHTNKMIRLEAVYVAKSETLTLRPTAVVPIIELRSVIWNDEHIQC